MKTKFEDNVASKDPKPSHSTEPDLPWKVTDEDTVPVDAKEAEYKETITGTPPLKVGAVLIVLLILTMFAFIANTVTNVAIDKYEAESSAMQKEETVSTLTANLKKTAVEKKALSESASALEKRLDEVSAQTEAQKELYTTVIETLSKQTDEEIQAASGMSGPDKR